MYFIKKKGKQHLYLNGNLILSHNESLIRAKHKSNAPRFVHNAKYILDISSLKFFQKIKTSWFVLRFVWGKKK